MTFTELGIVSGEGTSFEPATIPNRRIDVRVVKAGAPAASTDPARVRHNLAKQPEPRLRFNSSRQYFSRAYAKLLLNDIGVAGSVFSLYVPDTVDLQFCQIQRVSQQLMLTNTRPFDSRIDGGNRPPRPD